jgi:hypothetical protein
VVAGTEKFWFARGYVIFETYSFNVPTHTTLLFDSVQRDGAAFLF